MTRRLLISVCLLALCTVVSCTSKSDTSSFKELHRTQSGELAIVALSDDGVVQQGKDSFVLEFRRGDSLVDVGTVRVNATMVMAGMGPMLGTVEVHSTDTKGRYSVTSDLNMAGSWRFTVDWNGPAGQGSVSFPETVR